MGKALKTSSALNFQPMSSVEGVVIAVEDVDVVVTVVETFDVVVGDIVVVVDDPDDDDEDQLLLSGSNESSDGFERPNTEPQLMPRSVSSSFSELVVSSSVSISDELAEDE